MSNSKATRPPVVTILGHVDHGKTSLLDRIRHATVAAGEVGGITQAIGAYQIEHNGQKITFIDTPGHAAFSAMRRRGGQAADVAILIVAADDSVMPQTRESIEHIQKAGIPYVVAVNKTDLPGVNPERVKTDLANEGVYVEGYGGNIPLVNISAKTGAGVDDLLEVILLLAEMEQLVDNSADKPAGGVVIESSLHSQKGSIATILVKKGTFKKNDNLFSGDKNIGKIRSMTGFNGKTLDEATPSTPFQIIGLAEVPNVGDILTNEPVTGAATIIGDTTAASTDTDKPNIILKADVQGSLEAIIGVIRENVNLVSSGVGNISDSDIEAALASGSEILGFNVKMGSSVSKLAEVEKIKFTNFHIIYQLFDYLKDLREKKIIEVAPKRLETGQISVIKVFNFGGQIVYGCTVTSGRIHKNNFLGNTNSIISSLKSGHDDVDEVKKDQEFGMVITPLIELKPGDTITSYDRPSTT